MEQYQHGQTSLLSQHGNSASRTAVHPGWLSTERVMPELVEDPVIEDETRFAALSQLLRTAGALDRAASDTLADLGLTAGAFFALLELSDASPVGLAPSELSRRLAVARRTATLYVDILTRQGWVERNAHPDDRRMVLARLTPRGEELVEELATAYKRRLAGLIQDMSPLQAERLRQLLMLVPVGPQLDIECDR
jgi:DNA-binding MarR family transcriptional regulator